VRRILWRWDSNWSETSRLYALVVLFGCLAGLINATIELSPVAKTATAVVAVVLGFVLWRAVETSLQGTTPVQIVSISSYSVLRASVTVNDESVQTSVLAAACISAVMLMGPPSQTTQVARGAQNEASSGSHVIARVVS
jgi:hypothetical protein